MNKPKRILVLCTGNSCRSQMAEVILNHDLGDHVEALSAGTHPQPAVASGALAALQMAGYKTDDLIPKSVESVLTQHIDLVITVCDNAQGNCPALPAQTRHIHMPFHDPHGESLESFIRVRDEIRDRLVSVVKMHFLL